MNTYIITLQLNYAEENYPYLINYIKSSVYWAHPMKNVWIVKVNKTATQIRDGITPWINTYLGEKVFVTALKEGDWGTNNVDRIVTDWMKINLK